MADPYYKGTPYGWCLDHDLEKSPYDNNTWEEYVAEIEAFLNKLNVNYSIVYYKTMVRVHVYFSAIKKMGFKNAVKLSWMDRQHTNFKKLYKFSKPPTHKDIEEKVRKYFILNDLPVKTRRTAKDGSEL